MGDDMDLNFNLLETGSLALAILATAFALQVIYFKIPWKYMHTRRKHFVTSLINITRDYTSPIVNILSINRMELLTT